MLFRTCYYILTIFISMFSLITLIYSIVNKEKYVSKNILIISIAYIIYLLMGIYLINYFHVYFGLEILYIYMFIISGWILYGVSIIINLVKFKKLNKISNKKKKMIITSILLFLLVFPILTIYFNVLNDKKIINNSDLILVYSSDGNGGFGDSDTFAYAVSDNYCTEFDFGIDLDGYYLKEFLPNNIEEANDLGNYKIEFNESWEDNSAMIYKNDKLICKVKNKEHYFNIELEKIFMTK